MLFCIIWRRRYVAAVLALDVVLLWAACMWPSLQGMYCSKSGDIKPATIAVTGTWYLGACPEPSENISIQEQVDGTYRVQVEGLHNRTWRQRKENRTARYAGGVLTLNEPVNVVLLGSFRKLYSIRVSRTEYLVPDFWLGEFQELLVLNGGSDEFYCGTVTLSDYSFVRYRPGIHGR
jgi:hypothetical protein